MSKHNAVGPAKEVSVAVELPVMTRGVRRAEEKRRRKRVRVAGRTLIVGLDLAREHQAMSFAARRQIVGRKRVDRAPQELGPALLPILEALCQQHGLTRAVIGLEPAGHYWELAAESFERLGLDYVLVHTLSVAREREAMRYTPESTDPLDAEVICELVWSGHFTEAALWRSSEQARLNALAREYLLVRRQSAAEAARLTNFWDRLLPEIFTLFRGLDGITVTATNHALLPFPEMAQLSTAAWLERVKAHAGGRRVLRSRLVQLLELIRAAHADPHRRSGEAMPLRIRGAAERRELAQAQKQRLETGLLELYRTREEAVYLDSIPGSQPLWNAIVLGLVGDFDRFDSGRTIVKLAGSEVNWHESGDWRGKSRISHRGRSRLRAAAYQQARALVRNDNPVYRARFHHLLHRTTRPALTLKQAYTALGNSYLRTAHVLVTERKAWEAPR